MSFYDFLTFLATVSCVIYFFLKWKYSYWRRKKIPHLPINIPLEVYKTDNHLGRVFEQQYEVLKSHGHKHGGLHILTRPVYMPVDMEYVKNILTKDFNYFSERGIYYNEEDDPLSAHLFNIESTKWKPLRAKLTPTFTSGKMKMMFQTLLVCADNLRNAMDELCKMDEAIEIKDVIANYTTDVIGSCAFGLDCNCFADPNNDFKRNGRNIFIFTTWSKVKNIFAFAFPTLSKYLRITLGTKIERKFFSDITKNTIEYREKNNVHRNDFMNLLIELKKSDKNENGLTMEEIAAQTFVFFIAGYETSSATISLCLYELACNPDIHTKARAEIINVLGKYDNQITYEAIADLKYLRQVLDETLRKYSAMYITRLCIKDYQIPDTDIVLDKGTCVLLPIYAFHHDPEYYPEPHKFDPERFSPENRSQIKPFTYFPFGEGPRNCLGLRFGLMQTLVGLTVLIKGFKFHTTSKTQIPLKFNHMGVVPTLRDGIWLKIKKIG